MRTIVKRALWGTLLAGGITLLGATAAQAADATGDTSGLDGLLSGTQALLNVDLPITIGGNGIAVLGDSTTSAAPAPAAPAPAPAPSGTTSGADGTASGTQAVIDLSVPVTIGGNAVSVLGSSSSDATDATPAAPPAAPPAASAGPAATTSGQGGIASGTQIVPQVTAPISVGGNAVSVLGSSEAVGSSAPASLPSTVPSSAAASTSGSGGPLGGTQLLPGISVPITIGGNAVGVLGDSRSVTPAAPTGPVAPADPSSPVVPSGPSVPSGPGISGNPAAPSEPGSPLPSVTALAATGGAGDLSALMAGLGVLLVGAGIVAARRRSV